MSQRLARRLATAHKPASIPLTSTHKPASIPFAHFLQNRNAFLNNLTKQAHKQTLHEHEQQLSRMLDTTGSRFEPQAALAARSKYADDVLLHLARDSFTVREMLACNMHLGHTTARWNPKMARYIYGSRAGLHIIDLEKTLVCLRVACQVVADIASKGGVILFVGTREPLRRLTYECAMDCEQYYVNMRWLGGTVTNRGVVLRNSSLVPDLLLVLDCPNNIVALREARLANIPTVAICDTDCDPDLATYVVPANDDAFRSVELVARTLGHAAKQGKAFRGKAAGEVVESASVFLSAIH